MCLSSLHIIVVLTLHCCRCCLHSCCSCFPHHTHTHFLAVQQVFDVPPQEDPLLHARLLLLCKLPGAGPHLAGSTQRPAGQGGCVVEACAEPWGAAVETHTTGCVCVCFGVCSVGDRTVLGSGTATVACCTGSRPAASVGTASCNASCLNRQASLTPVAPLPYLLFCRACPALYCLPCTVLPALYCLSLGQVVFAFNTGPLTWSIAAFRNSLVFHDLDRVRRACQKRCCCFWPLLSHLAGA